MKHTHPSAQNLRNRVQGARNQLAFVRQQVAALKTEKQALALKLQRLQQTIAMHNAMMYGGYLPLN